MNAKSTDIARDCATLSGDQIVKRLHEEMGDVIGKTIKHVPQRRNIDLDKKTMDECDESFKKYLDELKKGNNDALGELYQNYQEKRNKLNAELFVKTDRKYKNVIDCKDSKQLWGMINWKGEMKSTNNHPPIEELCEHFSMLYEPMEDDGNLQSLNCETHLDATDKPVDEDELKEACGQIKKGGYDFSAIALLLLFLLTTAGGVLLLLL